MNLDLYERMYIYEGGNWWYKGRRELITDMIRRVHLAPSKAALRILDVGCGTGLNSKSFELFGQVSGLDMSKEALKFCKLRGRTDLIRGSADSLPVKDGTIDIVCALDVLEHIEDDFSAMKEINRVLKPGGFLILTVPAFMSLWSSHDESLHHKRRYTRKNLLQNLKISGFTINKSTYWNFFLFPAVASIRLIRKKKSATEVRDDIADLPNIINKLLINVLVLENALIRLGISFPVGVSIFCICKKA
jgi:SAM-dependent methyltransferase